jgi:predicted ArsR family transcriptional regulator
LNKVVEYLSEQGYNAHWEQTKPGYVIHTSNCPYHHLAGDYTELCDMDFRMIAALLGGIVPRRVGHIGSGDETCAYLVPVHRAPAAKQPDPNGAAVQDSE